MLIKLILFFTAIQTIYTNREKVQPTFTYQSGDSQVFVFDDVVRPKVANVMLQLLIWNRTFSYYYPDQYEKDNRKANDGNLHWSAPVSPSFLIKTRFWTGIRQCYMSLPEEILQGRRYLPYVVHGTMLRRGDYTIPFKGDVNTKDSIFARIFLTSDSKKNMYSDQTFYDDNDEIVASIHPKYARVIMWSGNISTLIRPPSMGYLQAEYSMLFKLTPDKDLFLQATREYEEHQKIVEEYAAVPFPYTNHVNKYNLDKLNISEHLIGKYFDKEGNMIAFFDDIIPKEVLDKLRTYVTHYERAFDYQKYDPDSTESHDNVNWIIQFKVEKLLNTPYWESVKVLSKFLSNSSLWYPYDVATNLIQHTHHTRIHLDCNFQEHEYTFLLYLNPNWNENMYAETAFFDYAKKLDHSKGTSDQGGERDEMFDFIAAAIPKFGRIAIFRNLIPHTARPPSPNFLAARYTFPVKVSESLPQARAKMLMEALDYKPEDAPEDPLYANIRDGQYEPYLKDELREWVDDNLQKMVNYKEDGHKTTVKRYEKLLVPERFRAAS